jgi:ABC-type sugar transport system substrate-binding protein
MSKTIRIAVIAAVAALLATTVGTAQAPAKPKASKGTIAFLLSGPDLYYQYGLNGAKAAASRLGYDLKVFPNPTISPSVELANVKNAVAQGVKAITGYTVSLSSEAAIIDAAAQGHVPMFMIYGYNQQYLDKDNVVGFMQVDVVKYGKELGKWVKAHGPGGKLAILTGQLGRGDAEGYRTGFLQGLGCKGNVVNGQPPMKCGKFTYVATETGHWLRPDGYKAAQDIIAKVPDLKVLFSENDDMAVGAHTALVAAHKDKQVFMVSMNGAPYGIVGMKAGWIKAENTDSPAYEGLMGVRLLDAYLNSKIEGNKFYLSKTVLATKANIKQIIPWNFFKSPALVTKYMRTPLLQPTTPPGA